MLVFLLLQAWGLEDRHILTFWFLLHLGSCLKGDYAVCVKLGPLKALTLQIPSWSPKRDRIMGTSG